MATTQTLGNVLDQNSAAIENKVYYDRLLLKRLLPNLLFAKYGQKRPYNRHEGSTVNFRRFDSLAPALTPLTEGVTPSGNAISITSVQATIQQYGDFVEISDRLDTEGIDPVVTEMTEVLGEQAGNTVDLAVRDVVVAGTNVLYAGGRAAQQSLTSSDKISAAEIKKAVLALKKANAKPLEDGYYIGIIDPSIAYDLQGDSLWQDCSKYNGAENIEKGEVGRLAGVRFVVTTNVKKAPIYAKTSDEAVVSGKDYYTLSNGVYTKVAEPSTANIASYYEVSFEAHCAMIIGRDAYGVVDIDGSSKPEVIVKPAGSAGSADPLNQRSTVGWKAEFTAARLNELAMIRLECAATEA